MKMPDKHALRHLWDAAPQLKPPASDVDTRAWLRLKGIRDVASGLEMLFQIIAGRAETAAVIVTTNLPFSEWTTMFPNARLCKAMLDRLTDQAHIIETRTESYRFRRTLEKKKGGKK
jgi:hypothetical protein